MRFHKWITVAGLCPVVAFTTPISTAQESAGAAAQSGVSRVAPSVVPRVVRFNGVLKDAGGSPVAGPVSVTFTLHREQEGGQALWSETHDVVPDARGNYSVMLGTGHAEGLPMELFAAGEARWVGVRVVGQAEAPRTLLLSVPYALKARDAETVGGLPASAFLLAGPVGDGADAVSASQQVTRDAASAVTGGGTPNFIPLWQGPTTLANSPIFAINGMLGIGSTSPGAKVDVVGPNGSGGNAPLALRVMGGAGTGITTFGSAGAGGSLQLTGGTGGSNGPSSFYARGGTGATIMINGGGGGMCSPASSRCIFFGGGGGSIMLQPGSGGRSIQHSGGSGNVALAPTGGRVGVGTADPTDTLTVGVGGTTLADHWTTRSSRRLKKNIRPLVGALRKVEKLQGVSYEMKSGGGREIGVVAEDVALVVPEVVSRDTDTREIEGLDYSRLTALLIEAVKAQQVQIEQLKSEVMELKTQRAAK